MRIKLRKFICIALALVTCFTFVACGTEEHTEHTYGEWIEVKVATCTEDGTEKRVCSVCGEEETRTTKSTGHSYGDWEIEIEPTCQTEGTAKRVCHCGDEEEKTLEIVDHVYENSVCKWCNRLESMDKAMTDGVVKATVNYGGAGEEDWEVNSQSGVYKSKTTQNANLTFVNWQFEGGVIEWDMTVPDGAQYTFNTVCGVTFASKTENMLGGYAETDNYYCFGRAFTGEYVGYSKQNGAFLWQDYAKLSDISCPQGAKNHFKLEYDDANNIVYLTYDGQTTFFVPTVKLNGKYFGLYSEVSGTVFENITIAKKEYTYSTISPMNQSKWKEETIDGALTYTALTDVGSAVLKGVEFTTGTIEWDMTVPDGDFKYATMCGIIWGAESDVISIYNSQLLCSGMYPAGIFVTFSKVLNDTAIEFRWENAQQIADGNIMKRNVKVHYKFTYDGTNLTLEVGGQTAILQPSVKPFGKTIGLYSELAGTVFSNVTVTPLKA